MASSRAAAARCGSAMLRRQRPLGSWVHPFSAQTRTCPEPRPVTQEVRIASNARKARLSGGTVLFDRTSRHRCRSTLRADFDGALGDRQPAPGHARRWGVRVGQLQFDQGLTLQAGRAWNKDRKSLSPTAVRTEPRLRRRRPGARNAHPGARQRYGVGVSALQRSPRLNVYARVAKGYRPPPSRAASCSTAISPPPTARIRSRNATVSSRRC